MIRLALCIALSGCFSKPGKPTDHPTDASGSADASGSGGDAAMGSMCPNGSAGMLYDNFDGSTTGNAACGETGASFGNPFDCAVRSGGDLVLTFNQNCGCTWDPFDATAVVVHWDTIAAAHNGDSTEIEASGSGFDVHLQLIVGPSFGTFDDVNNVPDLGHADWHGTELWWRIRVSQAKTLFLDASTDGLAWTQIGTEASATQPTSIAKLTIDYANDPSTTTNAKVDAVYLCP